MLRTTLLRLSNIMLLLCLQLRISITRDTSNSSTNNTRDAVRDARAKIGELPLSFLPLAFGILLCTSSFETLYQRRQYMIRSFLRGVKLECR